MIPIVRVSSASLKSIQPRPSDPISIPSAEEEHQPGHAQAVGEQHRADAERQQRPGHEDQLAVTTSAMLCGLAVACSLPSSLVLLLAAWTSTSATSRG